MVIPVDLPSGQCRGGFPEGHDGQLPARRPVRRVTVGCELSKAEDSSERVVSTCGNHVVCDRGMWLKRAGRAEVDPGHAEVDSGGLRPRGTTQTGRPRSGGLGQFEAEGHDSVYDRGSRLKRADRAEVDSGRLRLRGTAQAGRPHRGGLGQSEVKGHGSSEQNAQRWTRVDCGRGARLRRAGHAVVDSGSLRPRVTTQVGRPRRGGLGQTAVEWHGLSGQTRWTRVVCGRGSRLKRAGRAKVDSGRLRQRGTAQAGRSRRGGLG
ncbi:hypothetical protein C4D60_Mb04t24050 [Musa balbisiana]|uniref:Uncharacterized protein n=1 Tax=Musa balbisiana TaxID=52838 RepID=A0A4S8KE91_MUSBA|nr:hypothetical protein C4D60_Mb04t24050 [Musa balbisiana]